MLVTTRTPLRVSLFGGGTDYPEYFRRHRGAVIGFAIDKHIYISALSLSAFVDYRYRLSYSRVETAERVADIRHPVVRAILAHQGYDSPTDFSVQADLPASAGLGSSSAFTVGFLNLVSALQGVPRTKMELARLAIHTEQELLRERVGVQDQLHGAFGGFNRFDFSGDSFSISPINVSGTDLEELSRWMLLVYTGIKRHASAVVEEQLANTAARKIETELTTMLELVDEAQAVLETNRGEGRIRELARLLDESWRLKKRLSDQISRQEIDELYELCLSQGALGGKLCGAGGGGFLLVVVPPERRDAFDAALDPRRCVSFRVELGGSVVDGPRPDGR